MQYSIILAHPKPGSFNHAIAKAASDQLLKSGHAVFYHDLYAEQFDPLTPADEIPKDAVLPPEIEKHCAEIEAVDGIIIVYPNWWSQPPAILKGWLDRVLRADRAYKFITTPNGEGKSVGLLKAKRALVINTANTPQETEAAVLGDPQALIWEKVVFGLCGVPEVTRLVFTPVIVSTLEQRQRWLIEVCAAVDKMCR